MTKPIAWMASNELLFSVVKDEIYHIPLYTHPSEKATCNKCNDTGWVCEWHPDKEAHKCCGGAGMPCECIGGEK